MSDHKLDAEMTAALRPEGEVTAVVTRGAEAWQFFAFVFAAVVTLALAVLEEIPDQRWQWRIAAKVLAFFGLAYLTLINVPVRNFLVGLLGTFKQEQH